MIVGCVSTVLAIAVIVMWFIALISAIKNPSLSGIAKLIWILIIIFVPLLGAILYLLIARK